MNTFSIFASETRLGLFAMLALALAALCAYANAYDGAFLLDDEFLIQKNRFLASWGYFGAIFTSSSTAGFGGTDSFYRPLQGLLYLLIAQMTGGSLAVFHGLNIVLHALNAILMFRLGEKLGFNRWGAFIASLLWALHPVHTEAVAYISATADPLYSFLCLAALNVMLPDASPRRMLAALALFILALLAKETALTLPLLALACLYGIRDSGLGVNNSNPESRVPNPATMIVKTWPLWLIAGLYILARLTVLHFDGLDFYKTPNVYTESIAIRFFTFLATLPSYAGLLLWPSDLHMERSFAVFTGFAFVPVMAGAAMLAACIALAVTGWQGRLKPLAFALLWFAAAHILHTGILLPVNSLFLEHWLYLPSIGLFLGLAEAAARLLARLPSAEMRLAIPCLALPLAIALGFATFEQNEVWKNPFSFYGNILKYEEGTARAHNNLAMAYSEKNNHADAIAHYEKAVALDDSYYQTRYNLASEILRDARSKEDIARAIQHLERALALNPDDFRSNGLLAKIYEKRGEAEKARHYQGEHDRLMKKIFGSKLIIPNGH